MTVAGILPSRLSKAPAANMLEELRRKITAELASVAFSATINLRSFSEGIDG